MGVAPGSDAWSKTRKRRVGTDNFATISASFAACSFALVYIAFAGGSG